MVVSVGHIQNIRFEFIYVFHHSHTKRDWLIFVWLWCHRSMLFLWSSFSHDKISIPFNFLSFQKSCKNEHAYWVFSFNILSFPYYTKARKIVYDWQCLYLVIEKGLYLVLTLKDIIIYVFSSSWVLNWVSAVLSIYHKIATSSLCICHSV